MIGLAGARKSMGLAAKNGDFTIRIGIWHDLTNKKGDVYLPVIPQLWKSCPLSYWVW
jgi:hypothetical protein